MLQIYSLLISILIIQLYITMGCLVRLYWILHLLACTNYPWYWYRWPPILFQDLCESTDAIVLFLLCPLVSPTLLKITANWVHIEFQAILRGARHHTWMWCQQVKVLIVVVFCFELMRDRTMSLLLLKFQHWALGISEIIVKMVGVLTFWS
jgi:hypothetical protein